MSVTDFYDGLAHDYHRLFADWDAAREWQSRVLRPGLVDVVWHMPADTGYDQPLVLARAQ